MIITQRHSHSARLERWLGPGQVEEISRAMRGWHGPPIALANVPGLVYAGGDGDFVGTIKGGAFDNLTDFAIGRLRSALRRCVHPGQLNAGFNSLSDLIAEATVGGKAQNLLFQKVGTASAVTPQPMSLWNVGPMPVAGGGGGPSGTGRSCTNATLGALGQTAPATPGDQQHITTMMASATVANTLLVYDRLWDMTYNNASALSTPIDALNRPARYQTAEIAPGNFVSGEVTTAYNATAHNLTLTYVDDAGNVAEAAAAFAAPVSAAVNRIPLVSPNWFLPLNSGDRGVRYLTQIDQSTITSVTGVNNLVIGHALGIIPCPIANLMFIVDGINSAFNLERIYDGACLSFLELPKTATTATTYNGFIKTVSG